jgi:hypothetical protein
MHVHSSLQTFDGKLVSLPSPTLTLTLTTHHPNKIHTSLLHTSSGTKWGRLKK